MILSSTETEKTSHIQKNLKIPYHLPRYLQRTPTPQQLNNQNWSVGKQELTKRPQSKQGKNPLDWYGNPTKCVICHSSNHQAQNCPYRENENTLIVNKVVHQSDFDNPNKLKNLTSETWRSALLDSGASKTVCVKEWLTQYVNNLSDEDEQKVSFQQSNQIYRFGDGGKIDSIHSAKIPAIIGSHKSDIVTDVVDNDIPLLFSKSSVKRAYRVRFNFSKMIRDLS